MTTRELFRHPSDYWLALDATAERLVRVTPERPLPPCCFRVTAIRRHRGARAESVYAPGEGLKAAFWSLPRR